MKKITVIALTIVLASATLMAQRGPRGRRGGDGERQAPAYEALKAAIGLSDEQVTAINELRQASFAALREAMQANREKAQQLREELNQDAPNAPLVGQLTVELQQASRDAKAAKDAVGEQIRALLTSDQVDALAELEAAQALLPAIGQANGLGLIEGERGRSRGKPGFIGGRGFGGGPGFGGPGGPAGAPFGFRGRNGGGE